MLLSEFMVEEHELRKEKIQEDYNDKYWDQRYTVVQRHIPSFLQKMAGKVLSTGDARPTPPASCACPASSSPWRRAGASAVPSASWMLCFPGPCLTGAFPSSLLFNF